MVEKGVTCSPHWTNVCWHKSSVTSFPAYCYNKWTPRSKRDSKLQWKGGNCVDVCRYRLSVPDVFPFNEVTSNYVRLTSPSPQNVKDIFPEPNSSHFQHNIRWSFVRDSHWSRASTQIWNNNFVSIPCCQNEVYFHPEYSSGRTTTYITSKYRNTWHFGGFKPGKDGLAVWTVRALHPCFVINPLNAELNPICHLLVLLGDLTFMGPCILSIFQYTSNKMQRYIVYLYLETVLHVSGGTSTHHQERIKLCL